MRKTLIVIAAVLAGFSVAAQTVTVGTLPPMPGGSTIGSNSGAVTFVDLSHPAAANGTLTTAAVRWRTGSSGPCQNAFKIKVIHPSGNGAYTVTGERGPFASQAGRNVVTLSPALTVLQGDFLAVSQLQSLATCGSVLFTTSPLSNRFFEIDKDTTSDNFANGTYGWGATMNAMAASSTDVVTAVIPAAGATQGIGSVFRTALQLSNGDFTNTISGKLVFHAIGKAGSATDPSITFQLTPSQTISYADIVTQMGQTGLGTIDVVSTLWPAPVVTARVFSDNGAAGTLGFTEPGFEPAEIPRAFQYFDFVMPTDPANFRANFGIRTLDAGATVNVALFPTSGGSSLASVAKTYAANTFDLVSVSSLLGLSTIPADSHLIVTLTNGSALPFVTTTDNRTSDSAVSFAR